MTKYLMFLQGIDEKYTRKRLTNPRIYVIVRHPDINSYGCRWTAYYITHNKEQYNEHKDKEVYVRMSYAATDIR